MICNPNWSNQGFRYFGKGANVNHLVYHIYNRLWLSKEKWVGYLIPYIKEWNKKYSRELELEPKEDLEEMMEEEEFLFDRDPRTILYSIRLEFSFQLPNKANKEMKVLGKCLSCGVMNW